MKKIKILVFVLILSTILLHNYCLANFDVEGLVSSEKITRDKDISSVDHAAGVTKKMCDSNYWKNLLKTGNDLILNDKKINELNEQILKDKNTNMYDLENMVEQYNADTVSNLLADISIPTRNLYINGQLIDNTAYFSHLIECIKTTGYTGMQNIKYGIVTKRADLKIWPIDDVIGYSENDTDDEMESSAANVNEPFIVNGKCEHDGEVYYFGYTTNYSGWINKKNIAICANKEEWIDSWKMQLGKNDFIVVTQDKITLESFLTSPETSNVDLMLGTTLKLVPDDQKPDNISGRGTWNNYVVYLPTRDTAGNYVKKYALISEHYATNNGLHVGYLPLTENNILDVAFSCLGNAYGWGGMLGNMDCSLYTRSIYRCFGLELPRDTSWQQNIPGCLINLSDLNMEEKEKLIETMPIGTLLYFPGHIMIYVGSNDSVNYVINDTVSLADSPEGSIFMSQYSVILNPLTCKRKNGKTWLENLNSAICFSKDINIDDCDIDLEYTDANYTGIEKKPKVQISYKGKILYENINYEIKYENNSEIGKAKVIITGIRNFFGETYKEFNIKPYQFLDSTDNQTYVINKDSTLSLRINAEITKFENIYLDDNLIDKNNYITQGGSTIISFNKDYLDNLSVGKHSLKVKFVDGELSTNLIIKKANNPKNSHSQKIFDNISINPTNRTIEKANIETDEIENPNNPKNSDSQKIFDNISINPTPGDSITLYIILFLENFAFIGYIIYNKLRKRQEKRL